MTEPLSCFVCGGTVEASFVDGREPYAATVFIARGQYGSTVFDPLTDDGWLEINIHDYHLLDASKRGLVAKGKQDPPKPGEVKYKRWDPFDD